MTDQPDETGVRRVLLVERETRLRDAIEAVLKAEGVQVTRCAGLADVIESGHGAAGEVALLAWTAAGGLLAEDQRPQLRALSERVPLVVMVPSSWRRLVTADRLGVAGILAKPFGAEALMVALRAAAGSAPAGTDRPPTLEPTL